MDKENFFAENPILRPKNEKETIAEICAWCSDKEEKDREAMKLGQKISHTICPECKDKMEREELAEFKRNYSKNDQAA